jgi:hypothetical protein
MDISNQAESFPFNCRHPDSDSLKLLIIRDRGHCRYATREELYCVHCTLQQGVAPCPFRPPKNRRPEGVKVARGTGCANLFGASKYEADELLDLLVDFYYKHGRMPCNTTEYRDDAALPHSQTIVRHFGSLEEAHRLATEKIEEQGGLKAQFDNSSKA